MLRIGLTGGIACGKTYVRRRMQDAGLATLDLDQVAHDVLAPGGAAYEDVLAEFGPGVRGPDGQLDRPALAARVFADPAARARLNALVHPRVREQEDRRASALAASGRELMVTDAALLVEAGVHLRFDRLVVVHCPPDEQLRRLRLRDGLDEAAAQARLRAQMPIEEKRAFGHFLVDTSGSFAQTDAAVDALTAALSARAGQPRKRPRVPRARALAVLALAPQPGPRGLTAPRLLSEIVAAGGLEMERVARLLVPPVPAGSAWYRAALRGGSHGPEILAAPVALWSLARAGHDPEYTGAAAASLARLTHADATSRAGACLAALALLDLLAVDPHAPVNVPQRAVLAERWAGAPPPEPARRAAEDLVRRLRDQPAPIGDEGSSELAALGYD